MNIISLSEYVYERKKNVPLNIENLNIYNKTSEDWNKKSTLTFYFDYLITVNE